VVTLLLPCCGTLWLAVPAAACCACFKLTGRFQEGVLCAGAGSFRLQRSFVLDWRGARDALQPTALHFIARGRPSLCVPV
jgi:hypothetical protein